MNVLNASLLAAGLALAVGAASAETPEEGFVAEFVTPAASDAMPETVPAPEDMPAAAEAPVAGEIASDTAVSAEAGDAAVSTGDAPSFEASFDTGPAAAEPDVSEADVAEADVAAIDAAEAGAETVIAEPAVLEADSETPDEPAYIDPEAAEKAERRREALKALRGPYAGISGGTDHVSIAGIDDGRTSGLMLGYRINEMLSAEFALNTGTYDAPVPLAPTCSVDSLTTGLFAAARSNGPFYLKGRIGLLSETLESGGGCTGMALDDAGISTGVGAGVRLGRAAVEFEYTQVEKEIYRVGWTLLLNF